MIQTCNDEYWRYMQKAKPEGAPCGKVYDDFDHRTVCPHEQFAGPSLGEIKAMQEHSRTEAQQEHERRYPKGRGGHTYTRTRTR